MHRIAVTLRFEGSYLYLFEPSLSNIVYSQAVNSKPISTRGHSCLHLQLLDMRLPLIQTLTLLSSLGAAAPPTRSRKTCTIKASGTNATDDAPAIQSAFQDCNRGGNIIFKPTTYYINSVLNITGLEDVDVDIQGKLLVS